MDDIFFTWRFAFEKIDFQFSIQVCMFFFYFTRSWLNGFRYYLAVGNVETILQFVLVSFITLPRFVHTYTSTKNTRNIDTNQKKN